MKNNVKTSPVDVIPVLLGADLNAYNVARAFHEAYGVKSYVIGRYAIGATEYTRIIEFHAVEGFDNPSVLLDTLDKFAAAHKTPENHLLLIGCTDDYVSLISKNKAYLSKNYTVPYVDWTLMGEITLKEKFYEYCEKHGIPYPKTRIYHKGDVLEGLGFDYPVIIKPSSSPLYWHHPFDGMKKVYRAKSREEAEGIIADIYGAGYPENLIIQDTIPGDDSRMYVLTAYCDRGAKVRMMCLGHVLLEEHTPKGLGNHCAIITEQNDSLCDVFKAFLEDIGYVGFANFDIKYDERDGSMRAFEINTRLGRSNYYVTAAGNNPAEYLTRDFILGEKLEGVKYSREEIYWRYVPDRVVLRYVDGELAGRIKRLKREGKAYSSMRYPYDLRFNPRRRLFIMMHERNQDKKFKKYYAV